MGDNIYHSALSLPDALQQKLIVATEASKTFGLSSVRISNLMIPNQELKAHLDAQGSGFIRLNLGCPHEVLVQVIQRIKVALSS